MADPVTRHPLLADLPGPGSTPPPAALSHDRRNQDPETVLVSQRWRLLTATARVIATHGYAATTIGQIAAEAGVAKKTFYKFFASKEAAFLDCFEAIDTVLAHIVEKAGGQTSTIGWVDAVFTAYVATMVAAPDLTRIFLFESIAATPEIQRQRVETIRRFAVTFQDMLDRVRVHDPDTPELTFDEILAIVGGINELCVQHFVLDEPPDTLPDLADRLCQAGVRMFAQKKPRKSRPAT
jgi:AcrR family transcriptional regulator